MQSETPLRERFGQYRVAGGIPDQAADDPERPMWLRTFGALLVVVVGFVATAPVSGVILGLYHYGVVPDVVAGILAVGLFLVAQYTALYLGGPLVDHLLGVSREVSA